MLILAFLLNHKSSCKNKTDYSSPTDSNRLVIHTNICVTVKPFFPGIYLHFNDTAISLQY